MKNDKEEPIIVNCEKTKNYTNISICTIDNNNKLIDNEIYNIYYSSNIYNISDDIVDEPIGEFTYIDSYSYSSQYYDISYFDFESGIIRLHISNKVDKNKLIKGLVGPKFDNVPICYQYELNCHENGSYSLECIINKNDPNKIGFNGKYSLHYLEGYSFNSKIIQSKLKIMHLKLSKIILYLIIIILIIDIKFKIKFKKRFKVVKIKDNI